MKKKNVILSSILSLVLCLSLVVGGTFALFTSESQTNISINSGKVEVVAEVADLKLYSHADIDMNTEVGTKTYVTDTFLNGGTAAYAEGTLTLDKLTPGDGVEFNISVANKSNVAIKYRVLISGTTGDSKLMEGLAVTIDGKDYAGAVNGDWTDLEAAGTIPAILVTIELPTTAGDEYQDLTVALSVAVEAVQGNVIEKKIDTWDGSVGTLSDDNVIDTAAEFAAFAAAVNAGNDYTGETVTLATSIDLNNEAWTAINNFAGTFDGQNYTISNLKDAALFTKISGNAVVKNLNLDGATRTASSYNGAGATFIGTVADNAVVDGCTVSNVALTWADTVTDCGDGISGVFGGVSADATVQNCEFNDITITAYGKLKRTGGVFSSISGTVSNCIADGVSIITLGAKGYTQQAGGFVGTINNGADISDCTIDNVTITTEYAALKTGGFAGLTYGGTITNCDMNNVTMSVEKTYSEFGGFIGQHDSRSDTARLTVADCEVTGLNMTVKGYYQDWSCGSAGFISGVSGGADISNCSVAGVINAAEATVAVGGFVGSAGSSQNYTINLTGCVADVDITVGDNIGGAFAGRVGGCMGTGATWNVTFNFTNCEANGTVTATGTGTAGDFYGEKPVSTVTFSGCKVDGTDFAG